MKKCKFIWTKGEAEEQLAQLTAVSNILLSNSKFMQTYVSVGFSFGPE